MFRVKHTIDSGSKSFVSALLEVFPNILWFLRTSSSDSLKTYFPPPFPVPSWLSKKKPNKKGEIRIGGLKLWKKIIPYIQTIYNFQIWFQAFDLRQYLGFPLAKEKRPANFSYLTWANNVQLAQDVNHGFSS